MVQRGLKQSARLIPTARRQKRIPIDDFLFCVKTHDDDHEKVDYAQEGTSPKINPSSRLSLHGNNNRTLMSRVLLSLC